MIQVSALDRRVKNCVTVATNLLVLDSLNVECAPKKLRLYVTCNSTY
jgi:hypothetical protein